MPQVQKRKLKTQIEKHFDSVRFLPESLNESDRTVELIFTTSKPVRMIGFTDRGFEEFKESLSMDKGHVDLDRMKRGGPLLDSHDRFGGVRQQLGVVDDVWTSGEELHGRVRFSKREDVEPIFQDVKEGIVRNASIGYRVYKYEDISEDDDKIRTLRATRWEPHEISLVSVPADSSAQVKSEKDVEKNDCEVFLNLKSGEETMPQAKEKNTQTEIDRKIAEEREKSAKIIRACRQAGLGDELAEEIIDGGHSYARALEIVQEKWAEKDTEEPTPEQTTTDPAVEITRDESETKQKAIADAMIHRFDPSYKIEDVEHSKEFMHMSAMEICKEVVSRTGFDVRGRSKHEIIKRAFHATSDFTNILENVASKRLQMGYESVPQVWRQFMRETTLRDFKQTSIAHLDEAPALEELGEGAEIKYGTMGDSKEVYQLATYAKGISVTRQTIINDDLGAFMKVNESFGRAAAHLENTVALKNQIIDNPTMGDSTALFHADHNNLGSAGALSKTTLAELEQLLMEQTDSAGREMELRGRYLLVGADNKTTAKELLAAQSNSGGYNVFGGEFDLLVSSLVGSGDYYLIADPNQIENVEYAYLEGARGVQIESENTFDVLGVKIRAYLDFAAKAVNYRSMAYNAGS